MGASTLNQREISALLDDSIHANLLANTRDPVHKARLLCLGREGASDWLGAAPSHALGLHLTAEEFVYAARRRLGLPVYSREGQCPAGKCNNRADTMGIHSLNCSLGSDRIACHHHLRNAIFDAAQMAALAPLKEPLDLISGHGGIRPADVFIPQWTNGKGTCLDITVTNPLQDATYVQCAEAGDYVVNKAYKDKVKKFEALCTSEGLAFFPLAVDTYGSWHKQSLAVISKLGTQQARHLDKEPGEQIRFLRQRLGISLGKDCSQMLAARVLVHAPAFVDGAEDFG